MIKIISAKNRSTFNMSLFLLITIVGTIKILYQWKTAENETSDNIMKIARTAK